MMDVQGRVPGCGDEEFVWGTVGKRFGACCMGGDDSLGMILEIDSERDELAV